jgi:hypothetical protein
MTGPVWVERNSLQQWAKYYGIAHRARRSRIGCWSTRKSCIQTTKTNATRLTFRDILRFTKIWTLDEEDIHTKQHTRRDRLIPTLPPTTSRAICGKSGRARHSKGYLDSGITVLSRPIYLLHSQPYARQHGRNIIMQKLFFYSISTTFASCEEEIGPRKITPLSPHERQPV